MGYDKAGAADLGGGAGAPAGVVGQTVEGQQGSGEEASDDRVKGPCFDLKKEMSWE